MTTETCWNCDRVVPCHRATPYPDGKAEMICPECWKALRITDWLLRAQESWAEKGKGAEGK
jgi:hypothetical protein